MSVELIIESIVEVIKTESSTEILIEQTSSVKVIFGLLVIVTLIKVKMPLETVADSFDIKTSLSFKEQLILA